MDTTSPNPQAEWSDTSHGEVSADLETSDMAAQRTQAEETGTCAQLNTSRGAEAPDMSQDARAAPAHGETVAGQGLAEQAGSHKTTRYVIHTPPGTVDVGPPFPDYYEVPGDPTQAQDAAMWESRKVGQYLYDIGRHFGATSQVVTWERKVPGIRRLT